MSDKQVISELRKLKRIQRDPRAADATYAAIFNKPAKTGFLGLKWRSAAVALLAAILIIPAAIDVAGGHDPLHSVRGAFDSLAGKSERSPASAKPTQPPAESTATEAQPPAAPAAEFAPESQAGKIEQAPVSAPAVSEQKPAGGTTQWVLKQARDRVEQLQQANPFFGN